jgi:hypothetical protein
LHGTHPARSTYDYVFNHITPQGQQKIKEDTNEAKPNDKTNIYIILKLKLYAKKG